MKKLLSILLLFASFSVYAQTLPSVPAGAKTYGTQPYLLNDGNILMGTSALKYRVVPTKARMDSLFLNVVTKTGAPRQVITRETEFNGDNKLFLTGMQENNDIENLFLVTKNAADGEVYSTRTTAFAPATGSDNYIRNNNSGTPQSASAYLNGQFRIDNANGTTLFAAGLGSFSTALGSTLINGGDVGAKKVTAGMTSTNAGIEMGNFGSSSLAYIHSKTSSGADRGLNILGAAIGLQAPTSVNNTFSANGITTFGQGFTSNGLATFNIGFKTANNPNYFVGSASVDFAKDNTYVDNIKVKAPSTFTGYHEQQLQAASGTIALTSDVSALVAQKGQANGFASLDVNGKLLNSQVPALALVDTYVITSQAAMLALPAEQGDVAIRNDESKTYILQSNPATVLANWVPLKTPQSPVESVNGQTGIVSLSKTDIGLGNVDNTSDVNKPVSNATQTALNARLPLTGGTLTGSINASGIDNFGATKIRGNFDGVDAISFNVPTYVPSTNSNGVASTKFVQDRLASGQSIGANAASATNWGNISSPLTGISAPSYVIGLDGSGTSSGITSIADLKSTLTPNLSEVTNVSGSTPNPILITANLSGYDVSRFTTRGAGNSYFDLWTDANQSINMSLRRSDNANVFDINGHSMQAYFGGNVGIGTTPTDRVEVLTNTNETGITISKSSIEGSSGGALTFKNVINNGTYQKVASISGQLLDGGPTTLSGALVFKTKYLNTDVNAAYVAPNGNWGFGGVTNPLAPIHVNGSAQIDEGITLGYYGQTNYISSREVGQNLLLRGSGTLGIETYTGAGWTRQLTVENNGSVNIIGNVTANNLISGTYTPTISGVTNAAVTPTAESFFYTRVGNVVTVTGRVNVTKNVTSNITSLSLSLPIPSDLTSTSDLYGNGSGNLTASNPSIYILADTTNDIAQLNMGASLSGAHLITFSFTYLIK